MNNTSIAKKQGNGAITLFTVMLRNDILLARPAAKCGSKVFTEDSLDEDTTGKCDAYTNRGVPKLRFLEPVISFSSCGQS